MEEQNNPHLLQEIEQEMFLEPASKGLRFANYLLDVLTFYVLVFVFGIVYGIVLLSQGSNVDDSVLVEEAGAAVAIQYLISFIIILGYFTVFEGVSKGRTIGKLITGTVAVKQDGSPITWKEAFLRSLCRIIPFEPFSALGTAPWHDSITRTTVVKKAR